jgi:hypothetical protein
MNKIEDPWSGDMNIVVESDADKLVCKRALGAAQTRFSTVLAIDTAGVPSMVKNDVSVEIARGLADTSLGKYGERGFSGLAQADADHKIRELSGDVEDFFDL